MTEHGPNLFDVIDELQRDLKRTPAARSSARRLARHQPKPKPKGPLFPAQPPALRRQAVNPIRVQRTSKR